MVKSKTKLQPVVTTEGPEPKPILAKIEGSAFESVKGAREELERVRLRCNQTLEESYVKFWEAAQTACPEVDLKADGLQLDASTEEFGFYLIRNHKA